MPSQTRTELGAKGAVARLAKWSRTGNLRTFLGLKARKHLATHVLRSDNISVPATGDCPPTAPAVAGNARFNGNGYCTVNFVGLLADPPGVVMEIGTAPAASPDGTTAVTCESETTVKVVAFTVPNFTVEA